MTDTTVVQASRIYAELRRRNQLIGDADILIAATALDAELVVVTNNLAHFGRISGLALESWFR